MKGEEFLQQPHHQHHHHHPKHEPNNTRNSTNHNLFSKLHPHGHHHLPFLHHDSRPSTPLPSCDQPNSSDGATIEVVRRPRGRPPGSKNKPKPPVIITRDPSDPPMSPYILEVPAGSDVLDSVTRFCHRKSIALCILTGSGTVANVTLRQPSTTPGATITFHGRFDILSLSATFFPTGSTHVPNTFTISLAGPQGQIVGGIVDGSLLAAGTVFIIGATFNNPTFHRLPSGDDVEGRSPGSGGERRSSPAVSGGGGEAPPSCGGGDSSGDGGGIHPVYSGNLGSEVIWSRPDSSSRTAAVSGGQEILWGDITPTSPASGSNKQPMRNLQAEMIWPPNYRAMPSRRSPPAQMMWPPTNGRTAASSDRSPPSTY
ncbi:AT-hook motif nuclear-localized protein 17 [Linum perenne]